MGLANNTPNRSPGNRSGNIGLVQLWQFLLELLMDKEHREVIHWLGEGGEFKLWGAREHKLSMIFNKLSLSLAREVLYYPQTSS